MTGSEYADIIKNKIKEGKKLTTSECLFITFVMVGVTTRLMHDLFGITP